MKRSSFTLIELLVVVAIIAMLAAFMLPALTQARRVAASAVCTSNLKQVALWGVDYSSDWGGVLPTNAWDHHPQSWDELASTHWYQKNPEHSNNVSGSVLSCPQAVRSVSPVFNSRIPHYCLNEYFGGKKALSGPKNGKVPKVGWLHSRHWWFIDAPIIIRNWTQGKFHFRENETLEFDGEAIHSAWPWGIAIQALDMPVAGLYGKAHPSSRANAIHGDLHVEGYTREQFWEMDLDEFNGKYISF